MSQKLGEFEGSSAAVKGDVRASQAVALRWASLGAFLSLVAVAGLFAAVVAIRQVSSTSVPQATGAQLPVTVTFREAVLSRGAVAKVSNYSDRPLNAVIITCANSLLKKSHDFHFTALAPHDFVVIGWHEGWDFSPGDTLTVSADGCAPMTRIVQK